MWIDDEILVRCDERLALSCFLPNERVVVLGASNRAELEANEDGCRADGVAILKRYGGGGTVLLYPGSVVVSLGGWVRQHFQNKLYFGLLNQAVIDALAARWPKLAGLSQNGLSDIVFGDRKVAGTSLFRSRNYVLYQASILVDLDVDAIAKYLKHPTKEPDYRGKRDHRSFLTSAGEISGATPAAALDALVAGLPSTLVKNLADELISPQPEQFPGLLKRARGEL